jgi:glycosyltransferase involved in cell wall biosynthesis
MREKILTRPSKILKLEESKKITVKSNAFKSSNKLKEIIFITTYSPRECGIATYSQDLIKALNNKFNKSFKISICALESENEKYIYSDEVKYILDTDRPDTFFKLAKIINNNSDIISVMIQHEFGFFNKVEIDFIEFLGSISKPIIMAFHTVLPSTNKLFKENVLQICNKSESIVVMTNYSKRILVNNYGIKKDKIEIIPHGTHLITYSDKEYLKKKYNLVGKKVLSTFGLLSSGKSIETTLNALPEIINRNPNVIFLIIGKTHPSVLKQEGEKYRKSLEDKITTLNLQPHVKFINSFLPLHDLLEYLQLTDIYLFTSKDPNQAVSGTFSYAISCGCPVISTPIPHAREVLLHNTGVIIDFESAQQLQESVNSLLMDDQLRKTMGSNGLHKMASTSWENAAIKHAFLFNKIDNDKTILKYNMPAINLNHVKKMTTKFGMIQFSKINQPDIDSGYTLDDNARALVALCQYYELETDKSILKYIEIYFNFIKYCMQQEGYFLNYVDEQKQFTSQNHSTNLADSNGRAIWALGYLISVGDMLPKELQFIVKDAEKILQLALKNVHKIHSTRSMAFILKGLYYSNLKNSSEQNITLTKELANRLVQMYRHEAHNSWRWFESYLTYANSILPEALLCAWLTTKELIFKEIAKSSFDFLISKTFVENNIRVISNKNWMHKGEDAAHLSIGGEQPIDVAYTILALNKFNIEFPEDGYAEKMQRSFNWFLGNNHLNQIIYNPSTGGCYDGLEENYVNLNQGAESTVSYLMARLTMDKFLKQE